MSRYGTGDVGFFDRIARLYDAGMPAARRGPLEAGLRFIDRPVERVLDAAGGTGRVGRTLQADRSVVVCDISRGMLRRAAADGLAAVAGDARRLPFRDDAFDAVVTVDALHHVSDAETALADLLRVTAPGGVVVVREFDPNTVRGRGLALAERLIGMGSVFLPPATTIAAIESAGGRAYLLDSGFTYTVVGVVPREDEA